MINKELSFIIYFYLLFMRLSQSHDQHRGFNKLIRVKSNSFFFLSFYEVTRSYDSDHGFGGMTCVIFYVIFLIDFFF